MIAFAKKVLVCGNLGYIGPVVVRHLRQVFPDANIVGFDLGLFAHCVTSDSFPEAQTLTTQVFGDIRDLPCGLLEGVDVVVNLAAISNDPMGNKFEAVTGDINCKAAIDLAVAAHNAGVRSYVYASSCSVYGAAGDGARTESDPLNPLTAYARSKVNTEEGLRGRDFAGMSVTALRFATACGMSDRLRLDLVLNDFVACALSSGEITVLSDGTPWRPLIAVSDMARAIEWAIVRQVTTSGAFLVVNAGCDSWNMRVSELALAVADVVPGTRVSINANAPPDRRSYQVDFSLFRTLAPHHQPVQSLEGTIVGLVEGLKRNKFDNVNFRDSHLMRLQVLSAHLASGRMTQDLRWRG